MSKSEHPDVTPRPSADTLHDPACEWLRQWQAGQHPNVFEFLARLGALSGSQLVEVLRVDQQQRWRRGDRIPAEAYLEHCPLLREEEFGLDVVYEEFLLREQAGENPTPEEYWRRFPRFAEAFRRQLEVYRALPAEPVAGSRQIPGYEIINELGRGGMGVVYRARQTSLNRLVALKVVLAGGHAAPADLRRFLREAEAMAHLQHPHIVQVYEVGWNQGQPFCTMELLDGGTLAQQLARKPRFDYFAVARDVQTLARAVHYAHERGVLHRDLKPGNVLLGSEGVLKIADFGLAKRLDTPGAATQTGTVLGTPGYMAPEQATGLSRDLGPATDVYALGAILYEMLTGRPPFQGENPADVLLQSLENDPPPPSRLLPAVPRDLETICLHCLQKEPRRRYATALDLAEDLRRFQERRPIAARPTPIWERALKWARRRPAHAALALVFAAAMLAFLTAGLAYAEHERRQALQERRLRQEARRALHEANMTLAWQAWERADITRVLQLLDGEQDVRGPEWDYLWRLCHSEQFTLPGHSGVYSAAISPDGRRVLAATSENGAVLWDVAERLELGPLPDGHGARWLAKYSKDGKLAVTGGRDQMARIWDMPSGKLLHACQGHSALIYGGEFAPDGRTLATVSRDGTLRLWDVASGKPIGSWKAPVTWLTSIACSPDGKTVAVGSWGKMIYLIDVATCTCRQTLEGHTGSVWSLAYSPDGKLLFSGSFDTTVRAWDAETGSERGQRVGHSDGIWCIAVSPDGRSLASACYDSTVKLWDVATLQPRATLRGHKDQVRSVAFSADSRTLISGSVDGSIRGWDAATGQGRFAVEASTDMIRSLVVSPDGTRLIAGSREGTLTLWDAASGHAAGQRLGHTADVLAMAWSSDGKTLCSGSQDKQIILWDWAGHDLQKRLVLTGSPTNVGAVAFSPDGKTLASGCEEGTILLWDLEARKVDSELVGHTNRVTCLAFTRDGRTLFSASRDKTIRIWDMPTRQERASPLTSHTGEVKWIAISPDGMTLASASYDTTVRLWNLADRTQPRMLKGHTGPVWCLAFSPDGQRLFTGGGERNRTGEIRIWDVASGRELAALQGHAVGVTTLAVTPDGKRLASADGQGVIKCWDIDAEVARAAGATTRAP